MLVDSDYTKWIVEIKSKIRAAQMKAVMAVNAAVVEFYWDLGKMIAEKQTAWGTKFLEQLSKDLQAEFPDMKGLSTSNLKYCRSFYLFYNNALNKQTVGRIENTENKQDAIGQQGVDRLKDTSLTDKEKTIVGLTKKIPWGHNILIFTKSENITIARFYIQQTQANAWGRETLALQIKSQLHLRQGNAITNFKATLPNHFS